jgi:hypothetical protein
MGQAQILQRQYILYVVMMVSFFCFENGVFFLMMVSFFFVSFLRPPCSDDGVFLFLLAASEISPTLHPYWV